MTPVEIIEQATVDGVILALSPAGTITATGDQTAVDKWLPTIRDNKPSILCELQRERRRAKVLALLEGTPRQLDAGKKAQQTHLTLSGYYYALN